MKVRIGLLLDSWRVRIWQSAIIDFVLNHDQCEVTFVVMNRGKIQAKRQFNKVVYNLGRKVDRILFRSKYDCFGEVDMRSKLGSASFIEVDPIRSRHTDELKEADVLQILDAKADIIIRFGFRILKGGVLDAARFGVWSLHHGDTAVNRGGPPGFWEVINGNPVTGVTLQILGKELDGGSVVDKAFVRTDRTSFNRNQNVLFWSGVELFCSAINKVASSGKLSTKEMPNFYSDPLYRDPRNWRALLAFGKHVVRRAKEYLFLRRKQWRLYVRFNNTAGNSMYKFRALPQPRAVDWADPFVIKHDGYHVFFEELKATEGKAYISYLKFDLSGKAIADEAVCVLRENYHLSYPFVLSYNGSYYMTPESGADGRVWLYKAYDFPFDWRKERVLVDRELYDSTLLNYEHVWYLFATERPFPGCSTDQYLVIYYADDLNSSDWTRHPMSPVTRDVRCARPAGRIMQYENCLLRPAQIGAPNYGFGIVFMAITKLSKTEYEEVYADTILPRWHANIRGVHTYNVVDGMKIADAQIYH